MFKKTLILLINLLLIIPVTISWITHLIEMIAYNSVKKLKALKEMQYIRRYKVDRFVKHRDIDISFFVNEDNSVTLNIKGHTITIEENEVDETLDFFTTLNKKIIINGNIKNNIK